MDTQFSTTRALSSWSPLLMVLGASGVVSDSLYQAIIQCDNFALCGAEFVEVRGKKEHAPVQAGLYFSREMRAPVLFDPAAPCLPTVSDFNLCALWHERG